jgi:hypothetical protein
VICEEILGRMDNVNIGMSTATQTEMMVLGSDVKIMHPSPMALKQIAMSHKHEKEGENRCKEDVDMIDEDKSCLNRAQSSYNPSISSQLPSNERKRKADLADLIPPNIHNKVRIIE